MKDLDSAIKLITKLHVKQVVWDEKSSHQEIINHTLEQQGINKVIDTLTRIASNDENMKEAMKSIR